MNRLSRTTFIALCTTVICASGAVAKPDHARSSVTFEQLDADNDGSISRDEMEGMAQRRFNAADSNGDGKITVDELEALAASRARTNAEKIMTRLDKNDDGMLEESELPGGKRSGRRFDRMDTDGDGAISKAEYEAAREHMAKRRAAKD